MLPGELTGIQYFPTENPIPFSPNFAVFQETNLDPSFNFNRSFYPNLIQPCQELNNLSQQSSSLSNNSTSDEADEHQMRIIDERRQRRMISNRESARRSRMRKQKHLDELWSQVLRLRSENNNLMNKLNHVSESHEKVLLENAGLKGELSDLRRMLTNIQIGSPYSPAALRELEDVSL
ncbi:hypothetical protein UlMin_040974 [Ulmus minor]